MSEAESYDLIIVGGGPAGAASTLYAKRQGLKVLLVDKARFPRDKICGDALSGKAVAILHDLELLDKVQDLPGATIDTVVFGSPDHVETNIDLSSHEHRDLLTGKVMPMKGFVIRRKIFDNFLFEEARRVADTCIEECTVKDLLQEDSRTVGIIATTNGETREFKSKLVLGCDGFNSIVSRKAGLYDHDGRHLIVALRCYYENVADVSDQIELHFVDEVRPGYFWIFRLDNGQVNVGIGMVHDAMKRRNINLKDALDQVISRPPFAERFRNAKPLEKPVGWNLPVGSKRRKIHGNGFLILGDAAGLIDPFTGEGIGNAFYSARLAVDTAVEAISENNFSERFLKRYEDRLWESLGDELKISSRMQSLGRCRPLLNYVLRKAAKNDEVRNLICGMIANAFPKKDLLSPLFYLKLLLK
jgi:geranylgeranyl reductase family protein